jgi:hypothetical protein
MKKIIYITIILSLLATTAMAQDKSSANALTPPETTPITGPGGANYYPETSGTITKSGYTYKYRNPKYTGIEYTGIELSSSVELYNATNSFLDVEWAYKDGSPLPGEKILGKVKTHDFTAASQTIGQTWAMVDGVFTTSQKNMLAGKSMIISVRFNPATGTISDVYFEFFRNDPFVSIPVETYRSVELALKQNLTITVTDDGRKLNYIQLFWEQEF